MPLVISDDDHLRGLISFHISPLYEMFVKMVSVARGRARHPERARQAQAVLSPVEWQDLLRIGDQLGLSLLETAIDYPDHDNIPGFADYLENLDDATLIFYIAGRNIERETISRLLSSPDRENAVNQIISALNEYYKSNPVSIPYQHGIRNSILYTGNFRRSLVAIIRSYWEKIFSNEVVELSPIWQTSIHEKTRVLAGQEVIIFLRNLTNGRHEPLPPPFPPGYPLKLVKLIPSYYVSPGYMLFYGYGTVSIIYDAQLTERRREELENTSRELLLVTKALADGNRLKILRIISQEDEVYGHKLARLCDITQPAISRHMAILKKAGLVGEVSRENRIIYSLRREQIERYAAHLLAYLVS